jgi:hypothetical protein
MKQGAIGVLIKDERTHNLFAHSKMLTLREDLFQPRCGLTPD